MLKSLVKEELTLEWVIVSSWSVFKDNFWRIFAVGLLLDVPCMVIAWTDAKTWWLELGSAFFLIFLSILALANVAVIVESSVQGVNLQPGEGFKHSVQVLKKIYAMGIIKWLRIMIHCLMLIVPGFILGMYYLFSIFAVILRNVEGENALAYSKHLVKRNWWEVLGITAGLAVFYLPFWFIPIMVATFLTMGGMSNEIWGTIPGILLAVLFNAYFMVAFTIFFLGVDHKFQTEKETKKPKTLEESTQKAL